MTCRLVPVLLSIYCFAISTAQAELPTESVQFIVVQTGTDEPPTRLLVTIDGKPLAQHWKTYFERLFAFLDRDGNGQLNATEAARTPSPAWLKAQWRGDFDNVPTPFVPWQEIDRSPKDGHIAAAELIAYYRGAGLGQPAVQSGQTAAALNEPSARRLFEELAGGDAVWNEEKLKKAAEKLRRYDLNDDERWSAAELKVGDPKSIVGQKKPSSSERVPSLQFSSERKGPLLNVDLHASGDVPGEIRAAKSITPTEIVWLQNIVGSRSESMTLVEQGVHVKIRVAAGQAQEAFRSASQSLLQQFEIDDLDRNQSLDAAEAKKSPLSGSFQALLVVADRNNDGKLAVPELQQYLDMQATAAGQHVVLGIADHGVPLFEMLDANDDGTLTLRELRNAWQRVSLFSARLGSDQLAWNDLPRRHEWAFSIGASKSNQIHRPSEQAERVSPPGWFSKMDSNHDGDLSRREFLGAAREFQRLDKDADGLISPQESLQGFSK